MSRESKRMFCKRCSRQYFQNFSLTRMKFSSKVLKKFKTIAKLSESSICTSCTSFHNAIIETKQRSDVYLTHTPVMAEEILEILRPKDGQKFVDMTFGAGGHSKHLLSTDKDIVIYALDRDPLAYVRALDLAKKSYGRIVPFLGKFSQLPNFLHSVGIKKQDINGVIMDLGPSSMQLDDPSRGFSPDLEGPLDMRMDGYKNPDIATADDVLHTLDANELARIFKTYGEEKYAKKFGNLIVDARYMLRRIRSTNELVQLITSVNRDDIGRPTHSPQKVFNALRIFVNNELNELHYGLEKVREFLTCGKKNITTDKNFDDSKYDDNEDGRIAVISYHSLEDRIVKRHFTGIDVDNPITRTFSQKAQSALSMPSQKEIDDVLNRNWRPISKHVIFPSEEEILTNPRAKDAKLRAAARLR